MRLRTAAEQIPNRKNINQSKVQRKKSMVDCAEIEQAKKNSVVSLFGTRLILKWYSSTLLHELGFKK